MIELDLDAIDDELETINDELGSEFILLYFPSCCPRAIHFRLLLLHMSIGTYQIQICRTQSFPWIFE